MKIAHSLSEIPKLPAPLGLTIGTFDGVHLGHLALLVHLRKQVSPKGTLAVLTFSNHPASILRSPLPQITTLAHKMLLLEKAGVDLLILLPFTQEMAQTSFEEFLKNVREHYPFVFLVLGEGASFGKNREGDASKIQELGKKWGFQAEYLKKFEKEGLPISSGVIRREIEKGDLEKAAFLLGRPYSFYAPLQGNALSLEDLCLLPEGNYRLSIVQAGKTSHATGKMIHSPPSLIIEFENGENPSNLLIEVTIKQRTQ